MNFFFINLSLRIWLKSNFVLSALQLIVHTRHAQDMDIVPRVPASVRKDGRGLIALRWIKMPFNAYLIARDTVLLIWIHKAVIASQSGVEMIVQKVFNCFLFTSDLASVFSFFI